MGRGARLPPQAMPAAAQKAINRVDARSPTDIERRFQCPHKSTGERFEVCATASSRLTQPSGSERRSWKRKSPYNGQEIEGLIVFRAELLKRKAEKTADIVLPEPRDKRHENALGHPAQARAEPEPKRSRPEARMPGGCLQNAGNAQESVQAHCRAAHQASVGK